MDLHGGVNNSFRLLSLFYFSCKLNNVTDFSPVSVPPIDALYIIYEHTYFYNVYIPRREFVLPGTFMARPKSTSR